MLVNLVINHRPLQHATVTVQPERTPVAPSRWHARVRAHTHTGSRIAATVLHEHTVSAFRAQDQIPRSTCSLCVMFRL